MSNSKYSSDSDSSVDSFVEPTVKTKKTKEPATKLTKKTKSTSTKLTKKTKSTSKDPTLKDTVKEPATKLKKKAKSTSKDTVKEPATKLKKKGKKTKSTSDNLTDTPKKKRELNPIMKQMNILRNIHIGAHIGTKAPMKTIPPFKLVLAAARKHLKLNEKDKNTVAVVDKAIELFNESPEEYCKS